MHTGLMASYLGYVAGPGAGAGAYARRYSLFVKRVKRCCSGRRRQRGRLWRSPAVRARSKRRRVRGPAGCVGDLYRVWHVFSHLPHLCLLLCSFVSCPGSWPAAFNFWWLMTARDACPCGVASAAPTSRFHWSTAQWETCFSRGWIGTMRTAQGVASAPAVGLAML